MILARNVTYFSLVRPRAHFCFGILAKAVASGSWWVLSLTVYYPLHKGNKNQEPTTSELPLILWSSTTQFVWGIKALLQLSLDNAVVHAVGYYVPLNGQCPRCFRENCNPLLTVQTIAITTACRSMPLLVRYRGNYPRGNFVPDLSWCSVHLRLNVIG